MLNASRIYEDEMSRRHFLDRIIRSGMFRRSPQLLLVNFRDESQGRKTLSNVLVKKDCLR